MKTTHAFIAGIAALALVAGGVTYSQSGGSRGEVAALAVSPGTPLSCNYVPGTPPAFTLDCVGASSDPSPAPPTSSPTSAPTVTLTTVPTVTPSPTRTPLPTATSTGTPPPTSTATRIPTATAPTGNTTLERIIADITGSNPACIAGTEGFDWGGLLPFTGVEKNGPVYRGNNVPPNGAAHLTVWLMMNQQANCNGGAELSPNTNGAITISGMKVWVLLNTGEWRPLDPRIWGWQDNDPNYHGPIYASACCFAADPPYTVPHNRGKQAYTAQNNMPAGVVGFLALYNVRSTGGMVMVNCGADYYRADYSYIGDLMVGKFHALGPVDTLVSCTNVSADKLRANPPPLQ